MTVPIDTTPPAVTLTGVSNGAAYILGTVPLPACVSLHRLREDSADADGMFAQRCD